MSKTGGDVILNPDSCPVGVFDSGMGGLSVLREIHQYLPDENLIYVGDSAHAPYGDRSAAHVRSRSQAIADFLLDQGVKAIVIACNTATAEAAEQLRETMDVPVIGLEPAIKPATLLSKSGVIGVLATQRTIESKRLLGLTERYAKNKKVLAQACPGLVELVESFELDTPNTKKLLAHYILPLLDRGVDALILGCTHYPFLLPAIRKITGDEIQILETGKPVAKHLKTVLHNNKIENGSSEENGQKVNLTFYNSAKNRQHHHSLQTAMQRLWNSPIQIKELSLK